MVILLIKKDSLSVSSFKRDLFGKYSLSDSQSLLSDETGYQKLIYLTEGRKIYVMIPDEKIFYYRFQVPSDIKGGALKADLEAKVREMVPITGDEVVSDFYKIDDKNYLTVSASLQEYFQTFEKLREVGVKMKVLIPRSIAIYMLLSKYIEENKLIMFVEQDGDFTNCSIFDEKGPLHIFPKMKGGLKEVSIKSINSVKKTMNKDFSKIFLNSSNLNNKVKDEIEKTTGISCLDCKSVIHKLNLETIIAKNNHTADWSFDLKAFLNYISVGAKVNLFSTGEELNSISGEASKGGSNKTIVANKEKIGVFVIAILIPIGIILLNTHRKAAQNKKEIAQIISPTETPTPTPLQKKGIKINILNGSGVSGEASKLEEYLKSKGYDGMDTGNADKYEYKQTVIRLKKGKEGYSSILKEELAQNYQVDSQINLLPDDSKYDIEIIIGSEKAK